MAHGNRICWTANQINQTWQTNRMISQKQVAPTGVQLDANCNEIQSTFQPNRGQPSDVIIKSLLLRPTGESLARFMFWHFLKAPRTKYKNKIKLLQLLHHAHPGNCAAHFGQMLVVKITLKRKLLTATAAAAAAKVSCVQRVVRMTGWRGGWVAGWLARCVGG